MATPARATTADLADLGVAAQRIASVPTPKQQKQLNAASDFLDGYISSQVDLPLSPPYPQDIIDFECSIAAYRLLCNIGFNPMAPSDVALKEERDKWIEWAEAVSKGEITPTWVTSGDEQPSGPEVITATTRGYSERSISLTSPPTVPTGPFSDD